MFLIRNRVYKTIFIRSTLVWNLNFFVYYLFNHLKNKHNLLLEINSFLYEIFSNMTDQTKLKVELRNKIDQFFHENQKHIPLLKIINFLETVTYDYIASIQSIEERSAFAEVYKYCYENFRTSFPCVNANNHADFRRSILNYRKRLPAGGVILVNENIEFLCVVNNRDEVNFPMGKQDFADGGSLKVTALRELGEEAGVWLSEEEFKRADKYVEYRQYRHGRKTKLYHFYVIEAFEKSRVDLGHTKRGEVTGLVWVKPGKILNMKKRKRKIEKSELFGLSGGKGALDVSCFIRKIITQSTTDCNPFETFGSENKSKAEVFRDLSTNKEPYFAAKNLNLSKFLGKKANN